MGQVRLIRNKETSTQGLLGAFSNRWRDFDFHAMPEYGGEIVSSKAHADYETWLDKNSQHAPELWTWHTWGTARKSRATWWAFSGNAFYAYWPLTEDEAKDIESWAQDEDLAMSFGFYVLDYEDAGGIIDRYRAFEASLVPREAAANKWTDIRLVTTGTSDDENSDKGETDMAISKKKYEALVRLHGEGFAKALEEDDQQLASTLDAAGFDTKEETAAGEVSAEAPAELVQPPAAEAPEAQPEEKLAEEPAEVMTAAPEAEETVPVVTEEAVVAAIKRLEEATASSVSALAERLESAEKAIATVVDALTSLIEAQKEQVQAEENERKLAAAPPSLLAGYMPVSILSGSAKAASKNGDNATTSAVLAPDSALAKQAPTAPAASEAELGWFGAFKGMIRT